MKSLKKEIMNNLGKHAMTIEQLTRISKITRHQQRVAVAIREMADKGLVREVPPEQECTDSAAPKYFLLPQRKTPDRCQSGAGENPTRSVQSMAKAQQ